MVKTLCFYCRGTGLIPGQGTMIAHAAWPKTHKKDGGVTGKQGLGAVFIVNSGDDIIL